MATTYTNLGPIYLTQEKFNTLLETDALEAGREYKIIDWEAQEKLVAGTNITIADDGKTISAASPDLSSYATQTWVNDNYSAVALKPMKDEWLGWDTQLTTEQAAAAILADEDTKVGDGFLGGVSWSDFTDLGLGNAEVKAFVVADEIVQFEMTSGSTSPYAWFFNSFEGVWRSYVPIVNDLTTEDTTAALSAKQGKVLKDLIDDIDLSTYATQSWVEEQGYSTSSGSVEIDNKSIVRNDDGELETVIGGYGVAAYDEELNIIKQFKERSADNTFDYSLVDALKNHSLDDPIITALDGTIGELVENQEVLLADGLGEPEDSPYHFIVEFGDDPTISLIVDDDIAALYTGDSYPIFSLTTTLHHDGEINYINSNYIKIDNSTIIKDDEGCLQVADTMATQAWVEEQGYLTEQQDISGKLDMVNSAKETVYTCDSDGQYNRFLVNDITNEPEAATDEMIPTAKSVVNAIAAKAIPNASTTVVGGLKLYYDSTNKVLYLTNDGSDPTPSTT